MTTFRTDCSSPRFTRAAFPRLVGLTSAPICVLRYHTVNVTHFPRLTPTGGQLPDASLVTVAARRLVSRVINLLVRYARAVGTQKHISNWPSKTHGWFLWIVSHLLAVGRNCKTVPLRLYHHVARIHTSQKSVKYTKRWNAPSYLKVTTESVW